LGSYAGRAADYLIWGSTGGIGALLSLIRLWPLHILALACCYRPLLGAGISRNPKHCALTCFLPLSHAFSRHSHTSGMLVEGRHFAASFRHNTVALAGCLASGLLQLGALLVLRFSRDFPKHRSHMLVLCSALASGSLNWAHSLYEASLALFHVCEQAASLCFACASVFSGFPETPLSHACSMQCIRITQLGSQPV